MFLDEELCQIAEQIDLSKFVTVNKAMIEIYSTLVKRLTELDENDFKSVVNGLKRVNNGYKLFVRKMKREGKSYFKENGFVEYLKSNKKTELLAKLIE